MVKIFVGGEKQKWCLHEDLLCDRSDYFRKAFQGGFKEAKTKEIYLDKNDIFDTTAFGPFVDWVCGNTLQHRYYSGDCIVTQEDLDAMMSYCKLYTLAEYLGIEILQNIAVDLFIKHVYQGLDCQSVAENGCTNTRQTPQ